MINITSDSVGEDAPKIEFPCEYPIKIIGVATEEFEEAVLAVVVRHTGELEPSRCRLKPSAKGNYASLTVTITATGEAQLRALFEELKTLNMVKMVL